MSNFARKIKKHKEVLTGRLIGGRFPKHRCRTCHKMTLYDKEGKCIYCSGKDKELVKEIYNKIGLDVKEVEKDV